jgi:hypothetical protein
MVMMSGWIAGDTVDGDVQTGKLDRKIAAKA